MAKSTSSKKVRKAKNARMVSLNVGFTHEAYNAIVKLRLKKKLPSDQEVIRILVSNGLETA